MSMASAKVVAIGFSSNTGLWDEGNGVQDIPVRVVGRRDHNRVYRLIQAGLTQVAIDRERRVGEQAPVRTRPLKAPPVRIDNALHVCPAE
jgi:hypothetical protein